MELIGRDGPSDTWLGIVENGSGSNSGHCSNDEQFPVSELVSWAPNRRLSLLEHAECGYPISIEISLRFLDTRSGREWRAHPMGSESIPQWLLTLYWLRLWMVFRLLPSRARVTTPSKSRRRFRHAFSPALACRPTDQSSHITPAVVKAEGRWARIS